MTAKEALGYYKELSSTFDTQLDRTKYIYQIHDNQYFEEGFKDNPSEFQKVYWQEILQRAHWAALSSLLRNFKWVDGVNKAILENNLLSFTANLRCLIESCGDILLSLQAVPATLADNYEMISQLIKGHSQEKKIIVSKELEEALIHFAYARKIKEEEKKIQGKLPKYQNAKPASEYLKSLDNKKDNGPISELYSILCQFSHPAAHSIHYLLDIKQTDSVYEFSYTNSPDSNYIDFILLSYNDEIFKSLMLGFNSSLITLKTLNLFDYDPTKTSVLDLIDLDELQSWRKINEKFKSKVQ